MKLWFQMSNGKSRFLGEFSEESAAIREIHKFCNERNFRIYYTRIWEEDGKRWFDVGSHTELFYTVKEAN